MIPIAPSLIEEVFRKATLLVSEAQMTAAIEQMAREMTKILKEKNPIVLVVMNGGLYAGSELTLRLNFPLQMDYIHATRYQGEITGNSIHWKKEPAMLLEGRVVVIVDDILDKGVTLAAIVDYCKAKGAGEVYTAVLADKTTAREAQGLKKADFTGVEIEDKYVFGYGLDYHDYLRNVPGIYYVADEHMF